jgi:hypothetical protein
MDEVIEVEATDEAADREQFEMWKANRKAEAERLNASDPSALPPPDNTPGAVVQTESAFMVYLLNGHWVADDVINRPIQAARQATFDDFFHAAATIQKDVQNQQAASMFMNLQQQMMTQAAEQMRTRQIAEAVGGPVGQGLKIPGR